MSHPHLSQEGAVPDLRKPVTAALWVEFLSVNAVITYFVLVLVASHLAFSWFFMFVLRHPVLGREKLCVMWR